MSEDLDRIVARRLLAGLSPKMVTERNELLYELAWAVGCSGGRVAELYANLLCTFFVAALFVP